MKLQREKKEQAEREEAAKPPPAPKSILRVKSPVAVEPKKENGLSALMTGYDDSDDSDQDEQQTTKGNTSRGVSWPTDDSQLETTHVIGTERTETSPTYEDEAEIVSERNESAASTDQAAVSQSAGRSNTSNDKQDEQWKEFEALLGGDGDAETTNTQDAGPASPISQPASQEARTPKVESEIEEDEADVEDETVSTAEVEQASYEARIAKLRLKAMQRRKKSSTPGASLTSVATDYTPQLALSQEDQRGTKRSANTSNPSPLEILRQKRLAARKLATQATEDDEL